MAITTTKLENDAEWEDLHLSIDRRKKILAVDSILKSARDTGAIAAIIEEEYLDRDFTAEFSTFYSKVFKRHTKICRRVHFFSAAIDQIIALPDPRDIANGLEGLCNEGQYIGYIVLRPIDHAPLGRVILKCQKTLPDMQCDLLVRTKHEAHLLGAKLAVEALAYTQQDRRTGACAQASIWMAGRHFHHEHHGPWRSVPDITEAATRVIDQVTSSHVPAGSGGLTIEGMVRTLREMDRIPLLYRASVANGRPIWPAQLRPETIIQRYVDSGIPVIVVLAPWENGMTEAHAVIATGMVRCVLPDRYPLPERATRAEYCEYFLVNDDQRGVNLLMPRGNGQPYANTPYTLSNIMYLIVPLPEKVYIPAEAAERIAWDMVNSYNRDWAAIKAENADGLGQSAGLGDRFCQDFVNHRLIARTYLTYGWRYKNRILANTMTPEFRAFIYQHDLPRLVWVTEFGSFDSFNHLADSDASILGHAVIDATSSNLWESSRSIFHAPGYASRWFPMQGDPYGPYDQAKRICRDDQPYKIKIRGQ